MTSVIPATAQQVPAPERAPLIRNLRDRYYRPADSGLASFQCSVKYQFDTLPLGFRLPAELTSLNHLDQVQMILTYSATAPPAIKRTYPAGWSETMTPAFDKFFGLTENFVTGFLQTWGAKGMRGPIPSEHDVLGIDRDSSGVRLRLPAPGSQIEVVTAPDLTVTEITTQGQDLSIDEHPRFTASPEGLLLTANDKTMVQGAEKMRIRYELDYASTSGFLLPHNVHLMVGDNIDTRFSFEGCSVVKGFLLHTAPPTH